MGVSYDRLFHMMIDRKISNVELAKNAGISLNIVTRLKKDEYVSMESIEKICDVLNCGVDDILEFINKNLEEKKYNERNNITDEFK